MNEYEPRLPLTEGIGEPIWCSICGSVLKQADTFDDGMMACQCEGCREMMEARVRRRMGAEA